MEQGWHERRAASSAGERNEARELKPLRRDYKLAQLALLR
jgi:hypothetical protein